ncbi:hypothetical protein PINS_up008184 [Pythium insidiosum]|nr:hypothetical protein PINS_up008184 [Pythium insidiosum]
MGRWQQEYERKWRSYTADVLHSSGAAPLLTSYSVSAADLDVLQDVLRSLGSQTDVRSLRPTAAVTKKPLPPREREPQRQRRRRRQSSVRFTSPLVTADDGGAFAGCLPMTQVLLDDDPMHSDDGSGAGSEEEDEDDSDASMQSDESYVYRTPQPKCKARRRSSPSMSSFRSSTSTFPAFTPQDLRHSLDQAHRESASQSLRHRLADVSPIGPARLRFSVDGALLNTSSTVLGDSEEVLCDTMAMPPASGIGEEQREEEEHIQHRRLSLGFTPRPVPREREQDEEPLQAEPTTPDVGELDVSMQSMHLSEDHSFRDDGEIEIEMGMDVDADVNADADARRDERSSPGIVLSEVMQSDENERRDVDNVRTQLNFNDASDDEEQEEEDDQVVADSVATAPPPPARANVNLSLNLNANPNPDRWHWSAGASEDPPSEKQAPPPEVIVIDDDDMFGNTEESGETNKPAADAEDRRLERARLRLSDDEQTVPVLAKRSSTTVASRRPVSSSSRPRSSHETRTVFRTKLPLPVETYYTSVDERRRRRRRKLEDKIVAATTSTARTVPELRVELAPYQRKAVDWMLERERFPKRTLDDGTCSTESGSDHGSSTSNTNSSSRQRAAYYARLTDKVRGGILADEMGLGKTICCIAMICESLRVERARLDSENDSNQVVVVSRRHSASRPAAAAAAPTPATDGADADRDAAVDSVAVGARDPRQDQSERDDVPGTDAQADPERCRLYGRRRRAVDVRHAASEGVQGLQEQEQDATTTTSTDSDSSGA